MGWVNGHERGHHGKRAEYLAGLVVSWRGSSIGLFTFSANTTRKPILWLCVASKDMKKSGWILRTLSGLKLLVFVAFGTGVANMVRVARAEPLGGLLFTQNVALCGVGTLDAELGGCNMLLENLGQWVDKSLGVQ